MNESYKNQIPVETEKLETVQETIANLRDFFSIIEIVFKNGGRESVKPLLPNIYNTLIKLNKLDPAKVIYPLGKWNSEGDLTEAEFNELNRRRKILSNAVGIMTASGVIRHNLNPDVPEGFE